MFFFCFQNVFWTTSVCRTMPDFLSLETNYQTPGELIGKHATPRRLHLDLETETDTHELRGAVKLVRACGRRRLMNCRTGDNDHAWGQR